ncbi:MAG TPA: hypothetical protein VJ258_01275 [Candidatus Limnocylindrales bacterium]|nr:hypothetical protein [Candidatus Limnocylindrales bacterium]
MRSGNKPRRRSGAGTVQAPPSLEPVAADEQSGTQLPLEPLEEPAEILVRFSTDEPDAAAERPPEGEAVAEPAAEAATHPAAETLAEPAAAGPSAYEPTESGPVEDASLLLRLARIHLRTGSLTTARAQLESLAGRNQLDTAGTLDLAEARWRTGDLHGAGQAAGAYLAANGGEALGLVIAAEAASLGNHDLEARRQMEQAVLRTLTSLDAIFAGIPHRLRLTESGPETIAAPEKTPVAESPRAVTPATELAAEPEATPAEPAVAEPEPAAEPEAQAPAEAEAIEAAAEAEPEPTPAVPVAEAAGTSGTELVTADAATQPVVDSGRVQADTEIAAGIALLEKGDALLAALHLGVALRMTPELAQAVLGAIGDRHDLALELVRGDALRMQGHERDAGQAYQSVASALSGARTAAEAAAETPPEAAAEVPAEPAATIPTHAPQGAENPEPRPPEPAPPISWLD